MTPWTKILTKEEFLKLYNDFGSYGKIAAHLGVCVRTVNNISKRLDIDLPRWVKYSIDENFFARENELAFYWAGFIAADGCISSTSGANALNIKLSAKDAKHLEKFRDVISPQRPIHQKLHKGHKNIKASMQVSFGIFSNNICNDLFEKFGIGQQKSLTYVMPKHLLDHPLLHHFIRGYTDGDGTFYSNQRKNRLPQCQYQLLGTEDFLDQIAEKISKECGLSQLKSRKTKSKIYVLTYGGNRQAMKIREYLYQDATVYLERKYNIAIQAKPHKRGGARSKLTLEDAQQIINLKDQLSRRELASKYNVSVQVIGKVIRGEIQSFRKLDLLTRFASLLI